jgi:hypothetical protein
MKNGLFFVAMAAWAWGLGGCGPGATSRPKDANTPIGSATNPVATASPATSSLFAPMAAPAPAAAPASPAAPAGAAGNVASAAKILNPTTSPAGKPKGYRMVITMRLTTIEVPIGTASGSEEIWSYLDEEPVKAVRAVNLGRNGLRVGLGRKDGLGDLQRIFKRMTGQSPMQSMVATIPGDPLPIVMKEHQGEQTIFTYHNDRTLSGKDYPPGDYVLAVACTLDEDDPSKVLITATPQVRSTRRETHFIMDGGVPQMITESETLPFSEMTFQVMVPAKGFLVIGPGANSRNPTSVGYHFLVRKKEGVEFESMLVMIPEVLAAPMR